MVRDSVLFVNVWVC